ncbi:MAG: 4Fe-4S dicluster domain-containing protein [bacterium]
MSREADLRKRARELLAEGKVAVVVGYHAATRPGKAQPAFITSPEDCDSLIFDKRCGQNLANYLIGLKHNGRIAVIAKGCDSRSIVSLVKEHQLDRASLHVIGVGCTGMKEDGEEDEACRTCIQRDALECDEFIGEHAAAAPADLPAAPADPAARWSAFADEATRCIRCYACRQVCPNCYCPVCFVDAGRPTWLGKTTELSDNAVFHLMRALHMAGRCVECGSCARACPMGIDLMKLNRKAAQIVRERFGHTAGMKPDDAPPMAAFDPEDRQEFIK